MYVKGMKRGMWNILHVNVLSPRVVIVLIDNFYIFFFFLYFVASFSTCILFLVFFIIKFVELVVLSIVTRKDVSELNNCSLGFCYTLCYIVWIVDKFINK